MAVNSLSSGTIRSAGLVSGLDTEALVKQMSSLSKSRINTQQQKLDLLQWKQADYRKSIKSIGDFRDKYFNLLKSDSNLGSTKVFASRKYTSSDDALGVITSANAKEGTYTISDIIQKAKSASMESSAQSLDGVKLDINAEDGKEYTIKVNLDGLSKNVTFKGGADADKTQENLASALNKAFSGTNTEFTAENGKLKVADTKLSEVNHSFRLSSADNEEGMKALGVDNNTSSRMSLNTKLSDVAFTTPLKGNGFTFEINGERFTFSKNNTISDVIKSVNSSDAGVKMSFDSVSSKFKIEANEAGAGNTLTVKQTSGNLLSSMFGEDKIGAASSVSSSSLMSNGLEGVKPADGEGFGFTDGVKGDLSAVLNQSLNVTVNGVEKKIGFFGYDSSGKKVDLSKPANAVRQLNDELSKAFGSDAPAFSYDSKTQTFNLTSANTSDVISIGATEDTTGGSEKLLTALGFNDSNSTNEVSLDQKVFGGVEGLSASISFGEGKTLTLTSDSTLKDLIDGSYGNIIFEKGTLTLKGVDIANTDNAGKAYLASLFGEDYNYPGVPATEINTAYTSHGQNAIINLNGNVITNNSNSFTMDGTTLDISKLKEGAQSVSVTVSNDTSKAKETIKSFVEDYNKLVDELNTQVKTKYDKDYQPLTEEQREEMKDKEIEQWEEKAKTGLLYQDSTISNIITSLRSSVSGVSCKGMCLADFGIKTSAIYSDNGKLSLDETALDKALSENPEKVSDFFTSLDTGLAAQASKAIDKAISTTGSAKGTLIQLAGAENTSSAAENRISKQIASYKETIETLKTRYTAEQERYWSQFTALETAMNSYNSQSSWLSQQFAQ